MSGREEEVRAGDFADRIFKIEMRQAKFEKFKASVEVVAIILAGAWAFYQFIYEDKIKPFTETPSLTITSKLEKLGTHGQWQAIRATETVVNDSKIRVSILARTITLVGVDVVERPKMGGFALKDGTWNLNSAYEMSKPAFLQSHAVFFSGDARSANRRWWLEPGDTGTQTNIFFVRMGSYDVLRFEANYQFSKYDVVPAFGTYVTPSGATVLGPVDQCNDYDESPKCPVTSVESTTALSLW